MNVVLYPLPCGVHGFVHEDSEGEYTILLNANETRERNMRTLLHEMKHIDADDLRTFESADQIERMRHG